MAGFGPAPEKPVGPDPYGRPPPGPRSNQQRLPTYKAPARRQQGGGFPGGVGGARPAGGQMPGTGGASPRPAGGQMLGTGGAWMTQQPERGTGLTGGGLSGSEVAQNERRARAGLGGRGGAGGAGASSTMRMPQQQQYQPMQGNEAQEANLGAMSQYGQGLMDPGSDLYKRMSSGMQGQIGAQGAAQQRSAALRGAWGGLGGGQGAEVMQTAADIGQSTLGAQGQAEANLRMQAPQIGAGMLQSTFAPQGQLAGQMEQSRQFGAGMGEQGRQFGVGVGLQQQQMANRMAEFQASQSQQGQQFNVQQQMEQQRMKAGQQESAASRAQQAAQFNQQQQYQREMAQQQQAQWKYQAEQEEMANIYAGGGAPPQASQPSNWWGGMTLGRS